MIPFVSRTTLFFIRIRMNLINNPIISREILTHLRMPSRIFMLMGFLLISSIVFCIAYAFVTDQAGTLEQGGRMIFFPMVYVAMLIGIPIATMSAASIVREREEETLDLMMTTPMSHSAMIAGKVLATLLYSLFFLCAMMPFFYFSSIAGGISFDEMSQCIVVLFGFYCAVAMIGTFISLISVSSNIAGRYAITTLFLIYLGPSVFASILAVFREYTLFAGILTAISGLMNPMYGILLIQVPEITANMNAFPLTQSGFLQGKMLQAFMFYAKYPGYITGISNLIFAVILFLFTVFIFNKFSNRLSTKFTYAHILSGLRSSKKAKHPALEKHAGKESVSFEDHQNVILQKERLLLNRKILSNERNVFVCSVICTVVLTWFALSNIIRHVDNLPNDFMYYMLCVFCLIITALFAPVTPSYSVLVEHQKDTWDLLRTTLIPSRKIVFGKIWNGFYQASIPLLGITITFLIVYCVYLFLNGVPVQWRYIIQSLFLIAFFLSCSFLYCSIAVFYSSRSKHNRSAPHFKTFTAVLFHILTPFCLQLFFFCFGYFVLHIQSNQLLEKLTDFCEKIVYPFSPVYVFWVSNWSVGHYLYFTAYSIFLVIIGWIISYYSAAELKNQV